MLETAKVFQFAPEQVLGFGCAQRQLGMQAVGGYGEGAETR
jgi:hypothetical protein